MRHFSIAMFHQLKSLLPTKKTSDLLKEGVAALQKYDFDSATKAYEKIPADERSCKPVQGFLGKIESTKRVQEMAKRLEQELKPKRIGNAA